MRRSSGRHGLPSETGANALSKGQGQGLGVRLLATAVCTPFAVAFLESPMRLWDQQRGQAELAQADLCFGITHCRRITGDRGAWLSENKIYQNVRNSLTYTEVRTLEALAS